MEPSVRDQRAAGAGTPGKETPPTKEKTTERGAESRLAWEGLEAVARDGVQRLLPRVLEDEVDELLGRQRYERREAVAPTPGDRNRFGKPRRLSRSRETITVWRPRVRGLEERFEAPVLPLFKRRTEEVGRLRPDLYRHGLARGTSTWLGGGCSARRRR